MFDKEPKTQRTGKHAQDICDIVAIGDDVAGTTAANTTVLVRLQSTGEGRRDERFF